VLDVSRTTTILLDGLHDPANATAWREFDDRYRPIVVAFARRLGLSDADAADAAQETMTRFVQEYREGKYDRERGRLRSWLVGLAKYRIADAHRRRAGRREVAEEAEPAAALADDARLTQIWEAERRTVMLREALGRLRATTRTTEKTVRAFEMLVVGQVPVAQVADTLEMSAHDVYLAKGRVAQRLRDILADIELAYEADA
jgi:RNA polymerase sigma-70 factor (ECF subfamily)